MEIGRPRKNVGIDRDNLEDAKDYANRYHRSRFAFKPSHHVVDVVDRNRSYVRLYTPRFGTGPYPKRVVVEALAFEKHI